MPGKVLQEVLKLLPSGSDEVAFIRAWNMSELEMPAVLCDVSGSGCGGCRVAGGLYLRCNKPLMSGSNWCKTCHANMVSDGRPKHGIFAERIGDGAALWPQREADLPGNIAQPCLLDGREEILKHGRAAVVLR